MFVGFLIKGARRDAGNTNFANQPLGELDVVLNALGRDTAPIDHNEVTPLRLENFEAGISKRIEQHIALHLIIRLQILKKLRRQIESGRGGCLQGRRDCVGNELVRLVDRIDQSSRTDRPAYFQPVTLNVFPKLLTVSVRSCIPGSVASLVWIASS